MTYRPAPEPPGLLHRWTIRDVALGELRRLSPHAGGRSEYQETVRHLLDPKSYVLKERRHTREPLGLPVPESPSTDCLWFGFDDPADPAWFLLFPADGNTPEIEGGGGLPLGTVRVCPEPLPVQNEGTYRYVSPEPVFLRHCLRHTLGSGRDLASRPAVNLWSDGRNILAFPAYHTDPELRRFIRPRV